MVADELQTQGRRRSRQEVEADVRAALLRLLSQGKPFKDLTVDELARAAGLSRTAFYFYFPGKSQVLMAALEEATEELLAEGERWWGSGEGPIEQRVRVALQGTVEVFQRHSALLRTCHEVMTYDAEFAAFYNERIMSRFVSATEEQFSRDRREGRLRADVTSAMAEALVWMVERCNNVLIADQGRSPEQIVDAFTTVWLHAVYPDDVLAKDS